MLSLNNWVEKISVWYQSGKHDQVRELISLIIDPPNAIWGPQINTLQSKAIACWLDGNLRLFNHYQSQGEADIAYQYLSFAYAKLQAVICNPLTDIELKRWSVQRIQQLTVVMLEFCNQQSEQRWNEESMVQVDNHVSFMLAIAWDNSEISRKH